jgi:hypothetical protein
MFTYLPVIFNVRVMNANTLAPAAAALSVPSVQGTAADAKRAAVLMHD